MLADPASTPVLDRMTQETRPVRPGDVAVLVHTNLEAEAIATALSTHRIRATLARTGLMRTPEGRVLAAALHYVLDETDRGALAELEAIHGFGEGGPDAWLAAKLTARLDGSAAQTPVAEWQSHLDGLRKRSGLLSPLELVEAAVVTLDLPALAARWPDAPQRLANLDALRKFAKTYEQRCIDDGEGASLAGLLRFLSHLTEAKYRQSEERAADEQHAGSDDGAVTVMTYHKSKGLEWPVVVMASLDRAARDKLAFKVTPESDAAELDPDEPLKGRWIRYWPWPFGPGRKAPLEDVAARSPEGIAAAERNRRERARLLYVGFTRARDHVVLAARLKKGAPETAWVDELAAPDGTPALAFPAVDSPEPAVTVRRDDGEPLLVPARLWVLPPDAPEREPDLTERTWFSRPAQHAELPDYIVRPSDGEASGLAVAALGIRTVHKIHEPLVSEAKGELAWSTIGDAIHAFLAADVEGLTPEERRTRATRLLQVQGVLGTYSPQRVMAAADAFREFVERELPGARWRREVPIEARIKTEHGERKIDGRIDLLLETDDACVIVDHKSFAGAGEATWRAKAATYAGQLAVYAHAIGCVAGAKPVTGCWVHFTVGGGVVRLAGPSGLPARPE
jgi:ATP-dependent exoDNAse (exonuclease V) beta subunit